MVVQWTDGAPGTLIPADGPVVALENDVGTWSVGDEDPEVQVRALRERAPGYLWEARWKPRVVPRGVYRARIPARLGFGELVSGLCTVT